MPLEPGTRLGPHEIQSVIGEGGMGTVYKAIDTRLHRPVAIKVAQKNFSERFEREARVIAALNHPHICTLYDVGPNYLVMEFVDGKPIEGPMEIADAIKWARQILLALDHAHKRSVTHRDLKPGNIMIAANGVKVLDFGLARLDEEPMPAPGPDDATLRMALTVRGTVLGTPQYMPPEQVEGRVADARSDVWAFGCVLYEMLAGKRAFEGNTVATTLGKVLASEPVSITTFLPDAPAGLDSILHRCFKKDPEERYQAAKDIIWELDKVGALVETATPGRGRRPWMAIGVTAMAALALGVGATLFLQPRAAQLAAIEFDLAPPEGGRWAGGGAISPDGRTFASPAIVAGKTSIYTRPLDRSSYRQLPGTEAAGFQIAWSPDSRNLAFSVGSRLKRIALDSGVVQEICTASNTIGYLTWGAADIIVFSAGGTGLHQVAAAGGSSSPVFAAGKTEESTTLISPVFLPDGRRFIFFYAGSNIKTGIYSASVGGETPKLIFEHSASDATFSPPGTRGKAYLLFVRGEQHLLAQEFDAAKNKMVGEAAVVGQPASAARHSVSGQGTLTYSSFGQTAIRQMRWRTRTGAVAADVGEPDRFNLLALSPDGQSVAYVLGSGGPGSDIWIRELKRGSSSRLTFEAGREISPVWSPDGTRVAYYSGQAKLRKIMVRPANGSNQETELFDGAYLPRSWSPDGKWILGEWSSKIFLLSLEKGSKAVTFSNAQFVETNSRLSADGRWIAYQSNESGRNEIYVRAVPKEFGGPEAVTGKWQVSTNGATQPFWSRDGKELFFLGADSKIMAAAVEPGKSTFRADVPKALFESKQDATFVVAPDGRFLMTEPAAETTNEPVHVVVNWEARLPKK